MGELGKAVWRVRAPDNSAHTNAFDALVIVQGDHSAARTQRHANLSIPYEGELPNAPLTLIVHSLGASTLLVDFDGYDENGTIQVRGRAHTPIAVIARSSSGGVLVTGLPDGDSNSLIGAGGTSL